MEIMYSLISRWGCLCPYLSAGDYPRGFTGSFVEKYLDGTKHLIYRSVRPWCRGWLLQQPSKILHKLTQLPFTWWPPAAPLQHNKLYIITLTWTFYLDIQSTDSYMSLLWCRPYFYRRRNVITSSAVTIPTSSVVSFHVVARPSGTLQQQT